MRTNRRASGVLTLLALFFQLAVGLTHVHTNAQVHAPFVAAVSLAANANHAAPDEHRSHGPHSGITCDLCILLHVAAVGDVAVPPALAVPFAAPVLYRVALPADRPVGAVRHFLPQSRAPPAAV